MARLAIFYVLELFNMRSHIVLIIPTLIWSGCGGKSNDTTTTKPTATTVGAAASSGNAPISTEAAASLVPASTDPLVSQIPTVCVLGDFIDVNGNKIHAVSTALGEIAGVPTYAVKASCSYAQWSMTLKVDGNVSCRNLQLAFQTLPLCQSTIGDYDAMLEDISIIFTGDSSPMVKNTCKSYSLFAPASGPRLGQVRRPSNTYFGLQPETHMLIALEFDELNQITRYYAVDPNIKISCPEKFDQKGLANFYSEYVYKKVYAFQQHIKQQLAQ